MTYSLLRAAQSVSTWNMELACPEIDSENASYCALNSFECVHNMH